jgi:hypothetical protein
MKVTGRKDPEAARAGEPGSSFDELLSKQLGNKGRKPQAGGNPAPKGPAQPVVAGNGPKASPAAPGIRAEATLTAKLQAGRLQSQLVSTGRALSARTASRAHETSVRTDALLAQAHSASADTSRERQAVRSEDGLRMNLLRELERQAPATAPRHEPSARDRDRGPERCGEPCEAEGARPAGTPPTPATAEAGPTAPAARAEEVAALVERIEAAVKNGQPTLSLSLGAGAAAAVEIARTAKGEVSIRIAARGEARSKLLAQANELKEALTARGLKVRSLDISQAGSKG